MSLHVFLFLVFLLSLTFLSRHASAQEEGARAPMDVEEERTRTDPDFTVFIPTSLDGSSGDTGNEHFLVFDGPDGSLMAVWTQSTYEGQPDQRIVFARSDDEGVTWTKPVQIAGAGVTSEEGTMASWGFPLVSKSGRIYAIYNKHIGINDIFKHTTGLMAGVYSDDNGKTWSGEQLIPMRRSTLDNPDEAYPANWIVWQKPTRVSRGKYFAGFTRWVSPVVSHKAGSNSWTAVESTVEFMRFENIDDNPEPKDIQISWFACDDDALRVPHKDFPEVSVVQEPSVVLLPDERLFVVMRTSAGYISYSVSDDAGETWREPKPLRRTDDGPTLPHPLSPSPLYPTIDGRFVQLYHNHDGHFGQWTPRDTGKHRRPICVALGEFRPNAEQPIWFSEPKVLMDNGGVPIGYGNGRADLAMYASTTYRNGKMVLWYPERKFFLLGKIISPEWLADMKVPSP